MNRPAPSRARSLARFSQNFSRKHSTIFDGASIGKQLQGSSFGKFHEALQGLQSDLPGLSLKLPRVVVLGGKNAGKSSLLENITKCPVFPRDVGLCTKMPVRLQLCHVATEADCSVSIIWQGISKQLQSRDSILAEVEAIMQTVETVVEDELTVKICQVDVPTFELIDLPGIQLLPEAQAALTNSLAEKYLKPEHTLVLCVVDATIPSLTDSKALTMVHAARKLDSTILALTKSDLVRDESEVLRFFGRILRDPSEDADNQLLDGLAGCVAVANRNHRDHLSLVEAEMEEQRIFIEMLAGSTDPDAAPEEYRLLQENMGIKQLIVQLDKLFHNFIVQKWKPAALSCLAPLRDEVGTQIDQLGPAVEALSKDGLLETICDMVQYDKGICAVIAASVIQVTKSRTLVDLGNLLPARDWGTLAWAESALKIEAKVTAAVKEALDPRGDRYLEPVTTAFEAAFAHDTPLKLSRFVTLQEALVTDILPKRVSEAKKAAARTVDRMLKEALMQLDYTSRLRDTFCKLDHGIRGSVIKNIIQQVKVQPLCLPKDFVLTESAAVHVQRLTLLSKKDKLQTATDKISHIEGALSSNCIQPLAATASSQFEHIPDAVEYSSPEQHDSRSEGVPLTTADDSGVVADTNNTLEGSTIAASDSQAAAPVTAASVSEQPTSASAASDPAGGNDGLQMQAVPMPQRSHSTPTAQDEVNSIDVQAAAAFLQSTQQDAASGSSSSAASASTPDSPDSTPVPESFPAQAPASAASSPRAAGSAPAGVASAPAGSTCAPNGRVYVPGEVSLAHGLTYTVLPAWDAQRLVDECSEQAVAQINADQESATHSRPASPVASEAGSWLVLPVN